MHFNHPHASYWHVGQARPPFGRQPGPNAAILAGLGRLRDAALAGGDAALAMQYERRIQDHLVRNPSRPYVIATGGAYLFDRPTNDNIPSRGHLPAGTSIDIVYRGDNQDNIGPTTPIRVMPAWQLTPQGSVLLPGPWYFVQVNLPLPPGQRTPQRGWVRADRLAESQW